MNNIKVQTKMIIVILATMAALLLCTIFSAQSMKELQSKALDTMETDEREAYDATTIIVAQRISTILHAEQIIVLDEGKVAGIGTHEELMKTCATYQEIARSQLSEKELGGMNA